MSSHFRRRAWAGALLFLLVPAIAFTAAVDYFLKIDGIEGESTDAAHKGQIDVESWSWGSEASGNPAGCAAGKALFKTKGAPSSGKLAEFQMQRRPIPMMVVEVRGERHMLRNAVLTNHTGGALGDGSVHTFEATFACATHTARANFTASGKHFPKVQVKGAEGILIGLLLPAVQSKIAPQQAPMTLVSLKIEGTRALLLVKAGDPGFVALQQAGRAKQALPMVKLVGRSPDQSWSFSDVTILGSRPSATPGVEEISLNFARVEGPLTGFNVQHKNESKIEYKE